MFQWSKSNLTLLPFIVNEETKNKASQTNRHNIIAQNQINFNSCKSNGHKTIKIYKRSWKT